jgi:hypothetical protein
MGRSNVDRCRRVTSSFGCRWLHGRRQQHERPDAGDREDDQQHEQVK